MKSNKTRTRLVIATSVIFLTSHLSIAANSATPLRAVSRATVSVTSGKFLLAPVSAAGSSNPLSALTLTMTAKNDYFYLKNFGDFTIKYFSMTQTLASTAIKYCVNQTFKGGSYTKCNDNSNAITVGNTLNLGRILFSTSLASGASYQFSAVSSNSGSNVISVSISQNDLLIPGGSVINS